MIEYFQKLMSLKPDAMESLRRCMKYLTIPWPEYREDKPNILAFKR
ncbi:MAG: hypothetical protein QF506_01150 [Candidatus Woesearchaeota archaeon]|jgi:hypothetical protein|nr:hypothetical protein [Candidatus Woesearchaeota archaeon]